VKQSFRARPPSKKLTVEDVKSKFSRGTFLKVKVEAVKTTLSCQTSLHSPQKLNVEDVETTLSCQTCLKN
jgi:hypothetical protein